MLKRHKLGIVATVVWLLNFTLLSMVVVIDSPGSVERAYAAGIRAVER